MSIPYHNQLDPPTFVVRNRVLNSKIERNSKSEFTKLGYQDRKDPAGFNAARDCRIVDAGRDAGMGRGIAETCRVGGWWIFSLLGRSGPD